MSQTKTASNGEGSFHFLLGKETFKVYNNPDPDVKGIADLTYKRCFPTKTPISLYPK